jgi:hypothetical protein
MSKEGVELILAPSSSRSWLADVMEEASETHLETIAFVSSRLESTEAVFVDIIRMDTTLLTPDSGFDFWEHKWEKAKLLKEYNSLHWGG